MATNIRFNDVRSFVGKELPGFGKYDTEIVIAGEGTNYSNLPIESSVPLEEVVKNGLEKVDRLQSRIRIKRKSNQLKRQENDKLHLFIIRIVGNLICRY